jgi:hypothetical protein
VAAAVRVGALADGGSAVWRKMDEEIDHEAGRSARTRCSVLGADQPNIYVDSDRHRVQ